MLYQYLVANFEISKQSFLLYLVSEPIDPNHAASQVVLGVY